MADWLCHTNGCGDQLVGSLYVGSRYRFSLSDVGLADLPPCRIEAAGARVAPKRLPSGRTVGEPRLWLQHAGGPGLLLSR